VLKRREDFTEMDRDRLKGLVGVLDGEELGEIRDESAEFQEWIIDAGSAFRQINDLGSAGRFLDLAVKRDSTHVRALFERALVRLQQEYTNIAKKDLLTLLTLHPYHGGAHYNLGIVFEFEGDMTGAMTEFLAASRYLEDPTPAHTRLGALLFRLGDVEAARGQLEEVRRLDPGGEGVQLLESLLGSP
jgi:tetratricopeptide (TPR) repeat protein